MEWYRWDGDDLVLNVRVQPKASRDQIQEPLDGALKVRLTAPPVDGKANAHLTKLLAKAFGVAKRQVILESGATGRTKRVRVIAPSRLPLADLRR